MNPTVNIPVGATGTVSVEVTRELTVAHFHPKMPEVYGTPMMIYLMEAASAKAVSAYLPKGWVSVGIAVNIKHLAATPTGFTVTAKAEVVSVSDKSIVFNVEAHDGVEKIGEGTHVRAPVELKRFQQGIDTKVSKQDKN